MATLGVADTGSSTAHGALRVLLVEDNDGDAELLLESLRTIQRLPFSPTHLTTLGAARAELKAHAFDAVLLDLTLSDAAGLQAVRALRAVAPAVPLVVLTGMDDELTALHALRDGAQDYLVKGRCDGDVVARSIAYAIERQRADEGLRRLAEEQQRRADELADADRRKDEFLATLAHELRNPLAAMTGATTLLRVMSDADPKIAHLHGVLERQGRHLARMIDDLLDVSRMTRNRIVLKRDTCDLRELLEFAVEARAPKISAKKQRISLSGDSAVAVHGDCTRLNQVIENLLDNASKYSPAGAEIRVSLTARDDRGRRVAIVRVEDDGIGMDADFLPHVFDLFAQADKSLDRSSGGLGIGLSLVKHVAELHGGDIVASSHGPGRGSTFEVWLPALPSGTIAPKQAAAGVSGAPVARRILVVEDNHDAAEMLEQYLRHLGHDVVVAHDGKRGIEAALDGDFDLGLIDIGLPGADGFEIAERIRASHRGRAMALVALTGYGSPEHHLAVHAAGFDRHVLKPIEPAALEDLLSTLWRIEAGTTAPRQ